MTEGNAVPDRAGGQRPPIQTAQGAGRGGLRPPAVAIRSSLARRAKSLPPSAFTKNIHKTSTDVEKFC